MTRRFPHAPRLPHAPLLPLAACLMGGVAAGDAWLPAWHWALAALVAVLPAVSLMGRWPRGQVAGLCVCMVLAGAALGARQRQCLDSEWPAGRRPVSVVVASEPVVRGPWVVADALTATGGRRLRCRIALDGRSRRITVGDGLALSVYINKVKDWRHGTFSYRRFLRCQGITGEALVRTGGWQWRRVPLRGLAWTDRARLRFLRWRHSLLQRYRQWGVADGAYGVVAAMALGDKTHLDRQLRETYRRVGASHVLALSGLHLTIIYTVVSLLLGWRRLWVLSQSLIVMAIWAFALLVGLSPSVTRAALMLTLYALLAIGWRQRMSLNTLAFAAIVMLAASPYALYDAGFQLSFTAVLAILLIHPTLNGLVPPHVQQRHPWLHALWGLTTVSIAAQAGTAPLVAYHFGALPTYGLLASYVVIPLATAVLYLALACVALSPWPAAATATAHALTAVVTLMSDTLRRIAALPAATVEGLRLTTMHVALLYAAMAALCVALTVTLRKQK